MREIPSQYKKVSDKYTIALMDAAKKLWPIIRELGDSYSCGNRGGPFIVKIEPTKEIEG